MSFMLLTLFLTITEKIFCLSGLSKYLNLKQLMICISHNQVIYIFVFYQLYCVLSNKQLLSKNRIIKQTIFCNY